MGMDDDLRMSLKVWMGKRGRRRRNHFCSPFSSLRIIKVGFSKRGSNFFSPPPPWIE